MRLLNQIHGRGTERIRAEYPEVDVVEVPVEGDVDPSIEGDALVALTLATNLDQLVPRVRWVHSFSTGVDSLPEAAFKAEVLTCSRGAGAVPISEFVLAAMLAFEKHIPDVWIHEVPEHWNFADLGGLYGRSVGLIGLGGIGEAVARRALAFGMEVSAFRRRPLPSPLADVRMASSLDELLSGADHVRLRWTVREWRAVPDAVRHRRGDRAAHCEPAAAPARVQCGPAPRRDPHLSSQRGQIASAVTPRRSVPQNLARTPSAMVADAVGRSAERLEPLARRGAEAAVGSLDDPAFLREAFAGAAAAFVVIPASFEAKDFRGHQRRVP